MFRSPYQSKSIRQFVEENAKEIEKKKKASEQFFELLHHDELLDYCDRGAIKQITHRVKPYDYEAELELHSADIECYLKATIGSYYTTVTLKDNLPTPVVHLLKSKELSSYFSNDTQDRLKLASSVLAQRLLKLLRLYIASTEESKKTVYLAEFYRDIFQGADINAIASVGYEDFKTLLNLCIVLNADDMAEILIDAKADVNHCRHAHDAPIANAIDGCKVEMVRKLCFHPELNLQMIDKRQGNSMLMHAIVAAGSAKKAYHWPESNEIVRLVLDHPHTNIHHKNHAGHSALDLALKHDNLHVQQMLINHKSFQAGEKQEENQSRVRFKSKM